jgi:hypothetical protein
MKNEHVEIDPSDLGWCILDLIIGFALGIGAMFPTIWLAQFIFARFLPFVPTPRMIAGCVMIIMFVACRVTRMRQVKYKRWAVCGSVFSGLFVVSIFFVEAWILNFLLK